MPEMTKFLNVFSVVIYEILIFFSRDCIFGDKLADLCAAFALLLSNTTLQPYSLLRWLSFSFDSLFFYEIWVFVSIAVFSYLFQAWWLLLLM